MSCIAECSPDINALVLDSCALQTLNGGFYKFAFMKCDADFDDVTGGVITDVAVWEELIADQRIIVSSPLLAAKSEVSVTNLRVSSCMPEVPVGGSMPFTFEDYYADQSISYLHIAWWRQIQQQFGVLKFMAITCEGIVYGPFENGTWSIVASEVRENVKETPTKIAGSITVNEYLLQQPHFVSGLIGLI